MGASAVPTLLTLPELWRLTGTLHSSLGTTVEPGRASWAEKYASLAAIHDAQFPDRAPIDELHYINAGKLTNELRRRARQRVRQFVDALPDAVSTNVLEWLADVEADLAEHVESPGRPNRTGGEQGGEVASLEPQGAVRPTEMPETGLQSRYAMPTIRLFELLIKLRTDQLDRESAWSKAIRARAKVIAKRAKRALTDAQRELIAKVDAGHLPPTGQDTPDGRWSDGLKEIDEQAYLFYQHRGDPESPACQILAENDLKRRNAPEWRRLEGNRFLDGAVWRFRTTPWRFVVGKLQAERGMPFTEVELFEAVRLLQLEEAEDVPLAIRQFIAQQDDSGYTNELLAGLWAQYRADAEAMRLEGPEETPVGGEMAAPAVERGRQAKTSPGAAGGEPEKPLIPFPNPSAPMSKKDAADAWGGGMTVKKLSGLMESKKVRYVELNRETFVFCRDDIPNLPTR